MAARLATEYKHYELSLDVNQLREFIHLFQSNGFKVKTKILENGEATDQEMILLNDKLFMPITFTFRNMGSYYKCEDSCYIKDPKLTQALQTALRKFKGNALVHRIYRGHRVEYQYRNGKVLRIKEYKKGMEQTIYHNHLMELEERYLTNEIEAKIACIKTKIDALLDERNKQVLRSDDYSQLTGIDQRLKHLAQQLFFLEA